MAALPRELETPRLHAVAAVAARLGFAYESDAEHFGATRRVYRRRRPA